MHQSFRFNDKKYYYYFFYRKRNENPYISCTRRYGRMCVYGRCSPGACLLNVPVGFKARKAVLCLLGLHSESKPFQSRSTVEIPRKAVGGKKAEPFLISPGHNQISIYDDVTHISKMAPTPRNTREGHFLALCCA